MATKSFPVFDCDSHIVEPPEIWEEYVPARVRAWAKTQFHFHTDTETLLINGRAVPASRERARERGGGRLAAVEQEGGRPADAGHRGVEGALRTLEGQS